MSQINFLKLIVSETSHREAKTLKEIKKHQFNSIYLRHIRIFYNHISQIKSGWYCANYLLISSVFKQKNQFLFEFPREILEVEKWYFAGRVILRSLALKLGHSLSSLYFDPSNKQKDSVGVTLIPNPPVLFYFNLFVLIFSKFLLSLTILLSLKYKPFWTVKEKLCILLLGTLRKYSE